MSNDLKAYYNESKSYIALMQSHDEEYFATYLSLVKSAEKYLTNKKGKLLELGCGSGISTSVLAKELTNFVCLGTDISDSGIDFARKNYKTNNLDFQVVDALSLPFQNNEFDIVTSCDVIEHLPNTKIALSEMIRTVKPKGILVIKAPHHRNPIIPLIDFFTFKSRYPFTENWLNNVPRFISLFSDFVKKIFSSKVIFHSRVPDLSDTTQVGNDADAVYEVSVIDLIKFLKQNGFEIKQIAQARHNTLFSKIYTNLLPYFASIGIIAQKK